MKKSMVLLILLFVLLIIPISYANFFDDLFHNNFFEWITGKATLQTTTANVTVASSAPVILNVTAPAAQSVTEAGVVGVQFNFTVMDIDGASDLNNAAAAGYFNATSETTRSNTSCANLGNVNATTRAYWCNVSMYWFDSPTTWTVNATIQDNSANVASNITQSFSVSLTNAFTMAPTSLTWPSVTLEQTNRTSNNDPITLNNTANGNITLGNINITGYHLLGETNVSQFLNVTNFTVDITGDAAGNPECSISSTTSGARLVNNTGTNVTAAGLPRGNFTLNDNSTAQLRLWFCLDLVTPGNSSGPLQAQSYSTANTRTWSVRIASP